MITIKGKLDLAAGTKRLDFLQIFRGLAALLVLFHHIDDILRVNHGYLLLGGIFEPGWSGVDFFFVLSGFIIYYIHYKDIENPYVLKPYLQKRFVRIYPMTWIVTIPILPMFFIFPGLGDPGVQTNIWVIVKQMFLFPQERVILNVTWTLSHEVLFYLIFSLLIITRKVFAVPVIGAWILLTVLNVIGLFKFSIWELDFLFSPFHIEFLLGCFAAYIYLKIKINKPDVILISGVLLFGLAWIMRYQGIVPKYTIYSILLFGSASFLIVLGSVYKEIKKTKLTKCFLFIGDASFSIYLTHFPALSLLNIIFTKLGMFNSLNYFYTSSIMIIISIIIGCIAYILIEKPLLAFSRRKISGWYPKPEVNDKQITI